MNTLFDSIKDRDRVAAKIEVAVFAFVESIGIGGEFHMAELTAHVIEQHPDTAPDSPGRILRDLKKRRVLNYEVVSRPQSLYRVKSYRTEAA